MLPPPLRERLVRTGWILLPAAIMVSITLGQVLAAGLAAAWLASGRRWRWPGGTRTPAVAFFAWVLLATLLTRPYAGDLKDVFGKWSLVLLLPLAFAQGLDAVAVRRALLALAAATLALLPFFLRAYFNPEIGRAIAVSGGGPNLGTNMMLAAVACGAQALGSGGGLAGGLAALFAAVLLLSLNRGALLGAAAAAALLAARLRPALLGLGLFAGIALMAVFPHSRAVERLRTVVCWHESFTSQERIHMWTSGMAMIRDRPLLGFASRRNFIVWYSTRYRDPGAIETVPGHVHNSVLQTAILHGVPGLGLLVWWFAALWRRAGLAGRAGLAAGIQPLLLAAFVNAQVDFIVADGQRAMMLYTLAGLLLAAGGPAVYSTAKRPRAVRPRPVVAHT